MHRYPPNAQPAAVPYPPSDAPPNAPPYPAYPPPPQDNRRSNSPYVNAQGIPLPPPPTAADLNAQQTPSGPSTAVVAQAIESSATTGRVTRKRKLQSPVPDSQHVPPTQPHQLPPPPPPPHAYHEAYYAQPHPSLDGQGNPISPLSAGNGGETPSASGAAGGRQLSTSKRAEQNRKAQRAFRERRDAHVKALEQRSQLLDAALASADEANRRWEECRALVDQLRVENAALRAALNAAHATAPPPPQPPAHDQNNESMENGTRQDSRSGSVDRDAKE